MRLNCTLLSTLLFVSAALADIAQCPLSEFNSVEKLSRDASAEMDTVTCPTWTGAYYTTTSFQVPFQKAEAAFPVPAIYGPVGSILTVQLSIGGIACTQSGTQDAVTVGVLVQKSSDTLTTHRGFVRAGTRRVIYNDDITFTTGNAVKLALEVYGDTLVHARIENRRSNREKYWNYPIHNLAICRENVQMVVSAVPRSGLPLPAFSTVVFKDPVVAYFGPQLRQFTMPLSSATLSSIEENNKTVTSVTNQCPGSIIIQHVNFQARN